MDQPQQPVLFGRCTRHVTDKHEAGDGRAALNRPDLLPAVGRLGAQLGGVGSRSPLGAGARAGRCGAGRLVQGGVAGASAGQLRPAGSLPAGCVGAGRGQVNRPAG